MASHNNGRRFSLSNTYFSFIERRKISDRFLFNLALIAVFISVLSAVLTANALFLTSVPTPGGTIVEGIVGTPRFVNPVLAITRADHDMVALVYSGLMKLDEQGNLANDIAESIELSEDGRTYHVLLRKGVRFHNGSELTARDVAYTIALIQNPDLKSPLRGNWDGVLVEELGDHEMNIVLEEPYAPFSENLTVGILPRELWDELPIEQVPFSQNNTEPIGTGPYRVTDVLRNKSGLINAYKLSAFDASNYNPNITTVVFNFYQNEDELLTALKNKEIASSPSISSENFAAVDTHTYNIIQTPLPRTFAVFLNQNKSAALRDRSVRRALDAAIDKDALVAAVLDGYGIPTDSPVPVGFTPVEFSSSTDASTTPTHTQEAEEILREGGWSKTENGTWEKEIDDAAVTLSISITTPNTPLFDETATYIADVWRALGVEVNVSQFEQTDLVQSIIRPRDFEALLYGADIGRQADLYPFWHSSQKNDPGLNIAQYTNIDVDSLLQKMRIEKEENARMAALKTAETIIKDERPAIFLFVPTFGYVLDKSVTATPFTKISKQSERFANISKWHIRSNNLWPIFSNSQ
jgi:peptide/nickel transport system substrate-binding protein